LPKLVEVCEQLLPNAFVFQQDGLSRLNGYALYGSET